MSIDLERFCHFKDAEFRSIEVVNATEIKLTFGTQDKAREFDWISLELTFFGVSDARLIEESKLHLLDMSEGITLLKNSSQLAFALGKYKTRSSLKNATLYILSTSLKSRELAF